MATPKVPTEKEMRAAWDRLQKMKARQKEMAKKRARILKKAREMGITGD